LLFRLIHRLTDSFVFVFLLNIEKPQIKQIHDASIASDILVPRDTRVQAMENIVMNSAIIANSTHDMLRREETIIIPTIAQLLSEQEQKSINNLVIRKLGIFDSRLHLVGMYEAIQKNVNEQQLFQLVIPLLPQKLISRWKRTMYEPRAGALDKLFTQHE
jgi:hypothetical protein